MKASIILLLFAGFAVIEYALAYTTQQRYDQQQDLADANEVEREIYIMAHRCNTKGWFDHAIKHGANGIEVDIAKDNGKYYTWHGDTGGSTDLDVYLDHAYSKLKSGNGAKVALMIFDLKYKALRSDPIKADDITTIRKKVWEKLLKPLNRGRSSSDKGGFYAFYGVYKGEKYAGEFKKSIDKMSMKPREGVNYDADINSLNTGPNAALQWKKDNNIEAFFYSAGINVASPGNWFVDMKGRLEAAVKLRKSNKFGVYGWTYGYTGSAAKAIKDIGCDGVLGNMDQPYGWLPKYLDNYGLANYRLADRDGTPPFLKLHN